MTREQVRISLRAVLMIPNMNDYKISTIFNIFIKYVSVEIMSKVQSEGLFSKVQDLYISSVLVDLGKRSRQYSVKFS